MEATGVTSTTNCGSKRYGENMLLETGGTYAVLNSRNFHGSKV